ncbi:hypothetical protein [Chitinophaga cymbidii]|uniref:DUF4145 domain-containing protein n=1 Tax=Chitinophaga cymbidii TaxID=1096750 RepID=A0A512RQX1_9BACT|nr:hypothetical protein [Chitinophaga cymbidii]GEP98113.1 hypothetical protein CCY01nite_43730 [Chitinophaga cymbidii]
MTLDQFIRKVPEFDALSAGNKIEYFTYYLTVSKGAEGIKAKDIDDCFDVLKTPKYSNSRQYLATHSKKAKGKIPKFIFQKGLYHLERRRRTEIDKVLGTPKPIAPSDNYFPLELFKGTRGYLESIAGQAAACYDHGLFDACSVMTRKLLEVLIIEAFERHGISENIKNGAGNFYYLSDLINHFINETNWNIGRNAKSSLPKLKQMGDLSAHNRRFFAKKIDVDKQKDDLRIVLEELIHLIDYTNWEK